MEPTESNNKPQQTGGLKLMTVFVVVLALHVVVIGGMTTYYLVKGGSTDADLLTDKSHKSPKSSMDGSLPAENQTMDASSTASTSNPSPDASNAPAPIQSGSTDNSATTTIAPTTPANITAANAGIPLHTGLPPAPPQVSESAATAVPAPSKADATSAPTADATAAAPTTDGAPYVVKAKDSLAKIAHQNHVSVAKLKAANGLNSDLLHIGQKLVIPTKTATQTAVATTATDASTSTAPAPTPAPSAPKAAKTPAVASAPAASAPAPATGGNSYTVAKGDTLTKIAHKFKTTPSAIMAANGITDPAKLSIGKKLKIPTKASATQLANVEQQ